MTRITPKIPLNPFKETQATTLSASPVNGASVSLKLIAALKQHGAAIDPHDQRIINEVWPEAERQAMYELIQSNPEPVIAHLHSILLSNFVLPSDIQKFMAINPKVTSKHLEKITNLNPYQKAALPAYLHFDPLWTSDNFDHLYRIERAGMMNVLFGSLHQSRKSIDTYLKLLLGPYAGADARNLRSLVAGLPRPSALEYQVTLANKDHPFLGENGIYRATNPILNKISLKSWHQPPELPSMLGLSRSMLEPQSTVHSALLAHFTNNHDTLPDATFGPEYELYFPGLPSVDGQLSDQEPTRFELIEAMFDQPNFTVTGDASLKAENDLEQPVELVFDVLRSPSDMAKLQNTISRLNDMGATTNRYSGVHVHFGIGQWNCNSIGLSNHPLAAVLDEQKANNPSTLQLLLAKQITLNLANAQDIFYQVSRLSEYSKPIGDLPLDHSNDELEQFSQAIIGARNLAELSNAAQKGTSDLDRYYLLNLKPAYDKHQTFEVRGFTKNFADSMDVDPNLLLRDIIYLQDLIKLSITDVAEAINNLDQDSGVMKDQTLQLEQLPLKANPAFRTNTHQYVQDSLMLGIVHALGQRSTEKKLATMQALIEKRHLLNEQSLSQLIALSEETPMEARYPIHREFIQAMSNPSIQWDPENSRPASPVLHRSHSLRAMSDWLGQIPRE